MDENCTNLPDEDLAILLETLASVIRTPMREPGSPKPVVAWQGGKRWLVKELLPLIPEHHMYVELFCGGGALLCAKKPSAGEVINDLDSELVNLYRSVKWHLPELLRELEWSLNSREEFAGFKEQRGLTEIQRAARWFLRMKNGFGGSADHFGRAREGGGAAHSSKQGKMLLLKAFNARLDKVVIENLDWRKCVELYDSKRAVFFCDPPYTTGLAHYGAWTIDDLAQFREEGLDQMKGTWILTIDDTPANRGLFKDCIIKAYSRKNGINSTKASTYHELIIRPNDGRHKP
jgi:DNA adenine methylase